MELHKIGLSGLALAALSSLLCAQQRSAPPKVPLLQRVPGQLYQVPNLQDAQPKLMWPYIKVTPQYLFETPQGGKNQPRLIPYQRIQPFQAPQGPQWPYLREAPLHRFSAGVEA